MIGVSFGQPIPTNPERIPMTSYEGFFFQTATKLDSYHKLDKDKLEFFPNREDHLRKISSFVKYKLQPRSVDEPNLYKIAGELLERCLLKKQYLKGVREYYQHEGKVLRDPKNLIDLIRAPKINLGRLLPPVQGVRLEVYAPPGINLQFENFEAGQQASTALAVAFGQWANAFVPKNVSNPNPAAYTIRPSEEWKSISKKPFFVWLETQHICTGKGNIITGPGLGAIVSPELLGCVKKIIELEERINHTLQVKDGFLQKLDTEENYDTTGMAGKGRPAPVVSEVIKNMRREADIRNGRPVQPENLPEQNELKTAAFVWTHKEELLVGEHKADENVQYTDFFHHTSLDAGNPVLCAGMIRVINGKVELISNDSGHYQPGEESLKRFVRWLQGQYCLTENAIVSKIPDNTLTYKSYPTVGEFLGEATPAATPVNVLMRERNKFLGQLEVEVNGVNRLYDLSQGKAVAFIRIRSPESKIASQYFGGDFKNDIDTAKVHSSNNMAWKIPIRIVLSLAGISKEPLAAITDNVKRLNQQENIQFSTTIYDLKPLKQGSTMSQLLQQKIKTYPK